MTSGSNKLPKTLQRSEIQVFVVALVCFSIVWIAGCSSQRGKIVINPGDCQSCDEVLQRIEYPDLLNEACTDGSELMSEAPVTISNFQEMAPWDLSVEDCVSMTLANSKVLNKIGGVVVNSPAGARTLFDQALIESNPNGSVEAALSAFDAQFASSLTFNRNERSFNNLFFGGGAASLTTNAANFQAELSKRTATGATLSYRNITDYNRNNSPANLFASVWDTVNQIEFRQPLLRGAGTEVNRIAGPNAVFGNYNGVLIARIRSDISLADFEASVRDLVNNVESNYWELYFAYRNLDTILSARDSARETWQNRKLRFENGVGRPDEEAQARQNYINFKNQAQNALVGVLNGQPGVISAERTLRRLMGLPVNDGRLIRPITEPTVAPTIFDWHESQRQALARRVEVRRQKWTLRQREMELLAAKQLNKWSLDMVGQYGFRGFGDNLFGSRSRINGSAFDDLINGDLDDWQLGFSYGGPIGNRTGHLAIRNAELNLVREQAVLKEQQRQILHDLGAAFTEVDRSLVAMKTSFNSRIAVQEELEPKRKRVNEGQDQVFFLLDAQQRAATAESAVHRAIADYNRALLNYSYTNGSLLSRYNIVLQEGPWSEAAIANKEKKASRFSTSGVNPEVAENCPVSVGVYDQSSPGPAGATQYVSQPLDSSIQPNTIFQAAPAATAPDEIEGLDADEPSSLELEDPSISSYYTPGK